MSGKELLYWQSICKSLFFFYLYSFPMKLKFCRLPCVLLRVGVKKD